VYDGDSYILQQRLLCMWNAYIDRITIKTIIIIIIIIIDVKNESREYIFVIFFFKTTSFDSRPVVVAASCD
jgi:hypothetical protein